jgi:pyruvate dehydrogenase E2 component (dihydrolipoamide acetyltransferase)
MEFDFRFPDIGEGVHEGQIVQWRVKPGDGVREGDILVVVETDKVVAEIPSPKDGTLVARGAEEGHTITVGEVLATLEVESAEAAEKVEEEDEGTVVGHIEGSGEMILPPSGEGIIDDSADDVQTTSLEKVIATPVARKIAADHGIDIAVLRGSGPGGRVMKKDVLEARESEQLHSGAEIAAVRRVELSTLRKTIARNLEKSQSIPAAVVHESALVSELVRIRGELNEQNVGRKNLPHLSYLPFFLKAAAAALRSFERFNAIYHPERFEVELHDRINIGLAVDTRDGLVVPVIRDVDALSIPEIQREISSLSEAARARHLKLDQLRGGTFTVSGYGSFGGTHGRPMILPPQVAILGIGRIHEGPAVVDGSVVAAYILPLSLVFDHRVVDGGYAAKFLTRCMELIEKPDALMASLE